MMYSVTLYISLFCSLQLQLCAKLCVSCGEGNLRFLHRLNLYTLEAMLPNIEASIAPHFCLLFVGNLGNIFIYIIFQCVIGCQVIVLYLSLVKSGIQHDLHAIFQKFHIISVRTSMVSITAFKLKCCKF